jgi:prolyl oligopeptidase
MRPAAAVLILILAGGCGRTPEPPASPRHGPEDPLVRIRELNAKARAHGVVEQFGDLSVEDPFRALEEESPLTRAWMDAQSDHTARSLQPWMTSAQRDRLRALFSVGSLGAAALGGERIFYVKREGAREQPALYMASVGSEGSPTLLLDPVDHGDRASLDWFYPSPDGRLVALGLSHRGDERSTLRVLDVESRSFLADTIPRTKWTRLAWLPDASGFYYTRYPGPGERGYDAEKPESYFPRVYFHALGIEAESDPLVYGSEGPTDFPSVSVSDDGRWVVLNVFRGWSRSDVYLLDRDEPASKRSEAQEGGRAVPVAVGLDALTYGRVHGGRLYLFTNADAPRWRLVAVDPLEAPRRERWRDVVPQQPRATLEGWAIAGDTIVIHAIDDVRSRLLRFDLDGATLPEAPLPDRGSAAGLTDAPGGKRVAFTFSSYLHAPSLLVLDAGREEPRVVDRIHHDVDLSRYVLRVEQVRSRDGTAVPVQLVHRRDLEPTGSHPVLLTGYGGFNLALLPSFSRSALYWLERGGVYAVANLRGGGEHGEHWHRAGAGEDKPRVFEDFEAVLTWLATSGISRPDRIVITGRSNGGLLMGATITRAPHAFAAAATYVGLYDMVRYARFPPAELWTSEYGDPEEPGALRFLHGYSPYHQVRDGVAYPAVLVEAADHDSRVHWAHSTKLAARLQEATASDAPVYFFMQRQVGHGAGTRLSDLVEEYARMFAFFDSVLAARR